tara:strand:- start:2450 stop:2992 length:543 start_codon:yes stop_codon:yes gene_type:complete
MTSIIKVNNIQNSSGTSSLTIDGSGRVTKPQLPFFHVEAFTATSSNASQTGVLNFNGIVTNQGSHWNSSNNRFEAPITGIYQFSFNGFGTRNSSGSVLNSTADAQVVLQKSTDSGSNYTTAAMGGYAFFNSGNGYINMSFTIALALNSGDYIRFNAIKAYVFVQDKASNYFASASGHLIG